eukprot:1395245-Amorphochlora_amoeboformis.AAC.1
MSSQSDIVQMVTCGAGPALAAIFSNPLEVVKVRMQMHMARSHAGIVTTASQIIKENGVTGLQAGLQYVSKPWICFASDIDEHVSRAVQVLSSHR